MKWLDREELRRYQDFDVVYVENGIKELTANSYPFIRAKALQSGEDTIPLGYGLIGNSGLQPAEIQETLFRLLIKMPESRCVEIYLNQKADPNSIILSALESEPSTIDAGLFAELKETPEFRDFRRGYVAKRPKGSRDSRWPVYSGCVIKNKGR